MQHEPPATPEQSPQAARPAISSSLHQDGFLHHEPGRPPRFRPSGPGGCRSASPRPGQSGSPGAGDAEEPGDQLRRLSLGASSGDRRRRVAGQRISEYENALVPPTSRQVMGFSLTKRPDSSNGARLADFPNEILTHILSHLHPGSHASVALVSKRFYALVTTPHAWRMAFMRYFPGRTALESSAEKPEARAATTPDLVRFETRHFGRLTPLATWRSEYLLRTRLLRSLVRGKPGSNSGGIGSSGCSASSHKRKTAVLTYNSKLPWLVTNIHAVFSNGKKPPRAIHGVSHLGLATMADPTSGKIEKWGLTDPFAAAQLDEVVPNVVPFGLADGPAAAPNVMDVSQPYGILSGEGFPGGRAYFRGVNEMVGRYLDDHGGGADPDMPRIPDTSDAICSVWIAKSSAVPATTQSMCGMLTGSALGVVTAYSLGSEPSGPRYASGDMTARWVLSPGVPIVSLKVDDSYSLKRKSSARIWAVALNALGELYYLTETPVASLNRANGDAISKNAWRAGRSAYWHLLEATRRAARSDELARDQGALRGAYSLRTSCDAMKLTGEQLAAEAREIDRLLRCKPAHFRSLCDGWDMQRRLEVDFSADDGRGAGEAVFVIDCGLAENQPARIRRFSRSIAKAQSPRETQPEGPPSGPAPSRPSLFGPVEGETASDRARPEPEPQLPPHPSAGLHVWRCSALELQGHSHAFISASGMDCSSHSLLTLAEDPLHVAKETASASGTADPAAGETPGHRARLLAVGTRGGAMLAWNAREHHDAKGIRPLRVIQTDSPEISCLAASALYLVHGGSDGLVQAWDPLASTSDPIRTLNARSAGRVPRHMTAMNPALRQGDYSAAGAIYLDPDPTVLRGVLSFGALLRYWTYSSAGHSTGRKRRLRHSDIHGRLASRRRGGAVSGYIAAEEAELRRENEQRAREQARLRRRFGVGALGDLTEEEAIRYAQMVSEESFLLDEQRRASDSAADVSLDSASSLGGTTADTTTSEPSVSGASPPQPEPPTDDGESEFEQQVQQAIRLSLLEGVNDAGQPPLHGNSPGAFEYAIRYKPRGGGGGGGAKARQQSASASASLSASPPASPPASHAPDGPSVRTDDDGLALALRLSLQDYHRHHGPPSPPPGRPLGVPGDDFPPLDSEGVGKGKQPRRW